MTHMTGSGTVWLRIDHDLVGRALAAKLRLKHASIGQGDSIRVVRTRKGRKA